MSQAEVAEWLKKNPGWHTTTELERATGTNIRTVRANLCKLSSWGEIEHRDFGNNRPREWQTKEPA